MRRAVGMAVASALLTASSVASAQETETERDVEIRDSAPKRESLGLLVAGGASYRTLFGLPVDSGVFGVGVGVDTGHLAVYARGDYESGRTDHGLSIHVVRIGGSIEGIVGRFRLGGGLSVSNVDVARVTNSSSIDRFGVGVFGLMSLDLVRFDDHALYLGVRGDLDASARLYGGALVLGFRL